MIVYTDFTIAGGTVTVNTEAAISLGGEDRLLDFFYTGEPESQTVVLCSRCSEELMDEDDDIEDDDDDDTGYE